MPEADEDLFESIFGNLIWEKAFAEAKRKNAVRIKGSLVFIIRLNFVQDNKLTGKRKSCGTSCKNYLYF
jgi:hypothetical protein